MEVFIWSIYLWGSSAEYWLCCADEPIKAWDRCESIFLCIIHLRLGGTVALFYASPSRSAECRTATRNIFRTWEWFCYCKSKRIVVRFPEAPEDSRTATGAGIFFFFWIRHLVKCQSRASFGKARIPYDILEFQWHGKGLFPWITILVSKVNHFIQSEYESHKQ